MGPFDLVHGFAADGDCPSTQDAQVTRVQMSACSAAGSAWTSSCCYHLLAPLSLATCPPGQATVCRQLLCQRQSAPPDDGAGTVLCPQIKTQRLQLLGGLIPRVLGPSLACAEDDETAIKHPDAQGNDARDDCPDPGSRTAAVDEVDPMKTALALQAAQSRTAQAVNGNFIYVVDSG